MRESIEEMMLEKPDGDASGLGVSSEVSDQRSAIFRNLAYVEGVEGTVGSKSRHGTPPGNIGQREPEKFSLLQHKQKSSRIGFIKPDAILTAQQE